MIAAFPGEIVDAFPYRLPFRSPFATSRVTHTVRNGLIVRIRTSDGVGVGEASPPPSLGVRAVLDAIAALRDGGALPPWVRFGLDTARLDLQGRATGRTIATLLDPRARSVVRVNATIGSTEPRIVAEDGARARAAGFLTVKVKVAVGSLADDVRRVTALREAVGPSVGIRIDANQGWTADEAIAALRQLVAFDIEYVEQPTTALPATLARVRANVGVRIAVDEAVTGPDAVRDLIMARAADIFVIKPARVGGFAPAREIAALAGSAGLAVVITSTIDTSIGVCAALHLAASLEVSPLACGLATGPLLSGDLVRAPLVARGGVMALPEGPGLGLSLDDDLLGRWSAT